MQTLFPFLLVSSAVGAVFGPDFRSSVATNVESIKRAEEGLAEAQRRLAWQLDQDAAFEKDNFQNTLEWIDRGMLPDFERSDLEAEIAQYSKTLEELYAIRKVLLQTLRGEPVVLERLEAKLTAARNRRSQLIEQMQGDAVTELRIAEVDCFVRSVFPAFNPSFPRPSNSAFNAAALSVLNLQIYPTSATAIQVLQDNYWRRPELQAGFRLAWESTVVRFLQARAQTAAELSQIDAQIFKLDQTVKALGLDRPDRKP